MEEEKEMSDEEFEAFKKQCKIDEEHRKRNQGSCEACIDSPAGSMLYLKANNEKYELCLNCLTPFVRCALKPEQFFNLLKNGHTVKEFFLHGDFYDEETGEALQPH